MNIHPNLVVETSVPLSSEEQDLEEPLLSSFDLEPATTTIVIDPVAPKEQWHLTTKSSNKNIDVRLDDTIIHHVFRHCLLVGWTLGFLLQCVSLGGTALMALHWETVPTSEEAKSNQFLYWLLLGVSNSWLLLFPLVCFAIERSWRVSGIRFLQTHLLEMEEPIITAQTRRMTFVASVCFLAGVVVGCFMAWGMVDLYLEASVSMLSTLLLSMMACLLLCKGMIVIYDSFST